MTYNQGADTYLDLYLIALLFLAVLFGVIAAHNHWPGYWIACAVCAGAFVYLLIKHWPGKT